MSFMLHSTEEYKKQQTMADAELTSLYDKVVQSYDPKVTTQS